MVWFHLGRPQKLGGKFVEGHGRLEIGCLDFTQVQFVLESLLEAFGKTPVPGASGPYVPNAFPPDGRPPCLTALVESHDGVLLFVDVEESSG
jgi:hypothetical protein